MQGALPWQVRELHKLESGLRRELSSFHEKGPWTKEQHAVSSEVVLTSLGQDIPRKERV